MASRRGGTRAATTRRVKAVAASGPGAVAPVVFRVAIPSQLFSYTGTRSVTVEVAASAPRLADIFAALDRRYPGIGFRIIDEAGHVRPHMQVFVGHRVERDLTARIVAGDEVMIVGALSGG